MYSKQIDDKLINIGSRFYNDHLLGIKILLSETGFNFNKIRLQNGKNYRSEYSTKAIDFATSICYTFVQILFDSIYKGNYIQISFKWEGKIQKIKLKVSEIKSKVRVKQVKDIKRYKNLDLYKSDNKYFEGVITIAGKSISIICPIHVQQSYNERYNNKSLEIKSLNINDVLNILTKEYNYIIKEDVNIVVFNFLNQLVKHKKLGFEFKFDIKGQGVYYIANQKTNKKDRYFNYRKFLFKKARLYYKHVKHKERYYYIPLKLNHITQLKHNIKIPLLNGTHNKFYKCELEAMMYGYKTYKIKKEDLPVIKENKFYVLSNMPLNDLNLLMHKISYFNKDQKNAISSKYFQ